ncbi:hypothetical protein NDU88_001892 [Pleurodeles waltl]|uniref:Uncharacterized protein n=1 Tax=Pleurodeles waltl TaxID=8319 RepID=A0AAV7RCW9_PLEWA|nr:hypothetical protein NDU88_001892 [Pleurodeles waltl]
MQLSPLRKAPWEPRVGCRAEVAAGSRRLPSGPPQPMKDERAGARCLSGVTAGSRRLKKRSPAVDGIQKKCLFVKTSVQELIACRRLLRGRVA